MRFYFSKTVPSVYPPYQMSLTMPESGSTDATTGNYNIGILTTVSQTSWVSNTLTTLAQTTTQEGLLAQFVTDSLAPQIIPAQGFTYAVGGNEDNTNANALFKAFVGLWRPNYRLGAAVNSGFIAARIYDPASGPDNITEFGSSTPTITVGISSSQPVYAQAGDRLVLQLWFYAQQSKAANYNLTLGFTQNTNYFDTTNDLVFYDPTIYGPLKERIINTS